jgi:hypothetical protein
MKVERAQCDGASLKIDVCNRRGDMGKPKKKTKTKKKELATRSGKAAVALYLATEVEESWKIVGEKLDVYEGAHLTTVIETAMEYGKQQGRAEVMEQVESLKRLFGKEIQAIGKTTGRKSLGKPHKKTITIER